MPGAAGDFHRPTERPTEPITAGLPSGPTLPSNPNANATLSQLLNTMASAPGASPNVRALADTVNTGRT